MGTVGCTLRAPSRVLLLVLLVCSSIPLALATAGCGAESVQQFEQAQSGLLAEPDHTPDAAELQALLTAELQRLGVDPERQASTAPTIGNEVFDFVAELDDPDGEGGEPPQGVELRWTERMLGDYNQDGLVGVADLTPLGIYFSQTVEYDDPADHNAIAWWPAGNPANDGGVEPGTAPAEDSAAANWRRARVDGNGDGEIGVSDITPIAQHWNERLDGYRIYRRGPDDEHFSLLANPNNPSAPWLIGRVDPVDPLRPVLYTAVDVFEVNGEYEYYVAAYDSVDDQEGPASNSASSEGYQPPPDELTADLVAAPLSGTAPLTVYFNAGGSNIPAGAVPNYEWDWQGDGDYDLDSGTDYAVSHTFTFSGEVTILLRVTDNLGGLDTDTVVITVNGAPDAVLEADVSEGDSPLVVNFDATGSADEDGTIELYEWDLDGDRVYETSSPTQNTATYSYDQIGIYFPSLRVTDNLGATDTAELALAVHGWWTTTLDSSGNVGRYNSLALIDGRAAVAYYQHGSDEEERLKYIRAQDTAGRQWGDPVVVDGDEPEGTTFEQRGKDCCMIEVAGMPAIAYYDDHDFTGQKLRYIRAIDVDGAAWGTSRALSSLMDGRLGGNNSMAIVNGNPAIACNSNAVVGSGRILCFFRADDALGDSWSGWEVIDTAFDIQDIQLTLLGDDIMVPAVSYIAFNINTDPYGYVGGLRMIHAADPDGSLWTAPKTVLDYDGIAETSIFDGLSLLLIEGKPNLVFAGKLSAAAGFWLYMMASDDMSGSSWGDPLAISLELPNQVCHSSMAFINGLPAAVFSSYNRYSVEYLRADDAQGATWSMEPQLIDSGVGQKVECRLLEVDGRPAVSYYDHNDGNLKFALYY